jgi:NCAIR mutase (PurE)-related protein
VTESELTDLLARFQRGEIDQTAIAAQLRGFITPPIEQIAAGQTPAAQVDLDRLRRCGYPEVVFAPGKTTLAIADVFRIQLAHGQNCLATRLTAQQVDKLLALFPTAQHNPTARTVRIAPVASSAPAAAAHGKVAVITAGTGDLPVAEEAAETARWMGCKVELVVDVGVAGPHRLVAQQHRFADADAIVVVAGMEGALPSVVGGHVACPVVAVPTSIGYGASFGGLAALLGMLNSCAANVTVVNIDAGFKGGFIAGLIAQRTAVARPPLK